MAANSTWEFKPYTKTIHRSSYPAIDPKNPANSAAGKVVVITGGGIGIGKGFSRAFVEAGAKAVVILGRRENILAETKAELEKAGSSKILTFKADALDQAALDKAFEATEKEVGKVDVVVANVGYLSSPSPAAAAEIDEWWRSFEINIKSTLLSFKAFLAHKSANSPTFISINAGVAHVGVFPTFSAYCASKIGEAHLVSYLQAENPDVRIVSMHPGHHGTEMNDKAGLPLSHDDISLPSSFAVWLASPAASWLGGRFVWAHWDVDELLKMKDEIEAKDELKVGLTGHPKMVEAVIVS